MNESTQMQDIMMNNKRAQSFMDPLTQAKIARLEGTMGSGGPPGLPKSDSLPQYSQDKSLPYRPTYVSCSLSGQESLEFPSPWSPSRTCVRNGESPVVQHSATEGSITNPGFYRHENVGFPLDSGSPVAAEELAGKHKLACCTGSPSKHSPSAAGMSPVGFSNSRHLSPSLAENTLGLAVPKPVYGHGPCCTDRKCAIGQHYGVERGLQRVLPQMSEDDWAAQYGHWAYLQKKEQEALMQPRMLPFEHCGERVPLKDVTTEGYHGLSPSRARRSAFTEPRQSSYIYCPARPYVPSAPEHCQRFRLPPQGHKDLPTVYEPRRYGTPLRVYQNHVSRYGEMPYYPQSNTQVYRPDNSHLTVDKQASGPCPVPQPYFGHFPSSYTMVRPNPLSLRNLPTYRMHLNTGQVNVFPDRTCQPSIMHQVEHPLDFSMRREQNTDFHREPHRQTGVSETFYQTQSQEHRTVPNHAVPENSTYHCTNQGTNGFPGISSHDYTASPRGTDTISNRKHSLHVSDTLSNHAVQSKAQRIECDDKCDLTSLKRPQKIDQKKINEPQPPFSPPMPVINKVFSLAPYKAYLEATGMLSPAQDPQSSEVPVELKSVNKEPEREDMDSKKHLLRNHFKVEAVKTPPTSCHDSAENHIIKIKQEKMRGDELSCQAKNQSPSAVIKQSPDAVKIKEEPEDVELSECDTEHSLVIVKSDYEAECKPVTPEIPEPSPECKTEPGVMERVENGAEQTSATKQPSPPAALPPAPPTPPQTPQTAFTFGQIPPHCLKLSAYKIIVPEILKAPVPSIPVVVQSPAEPKPPVNSSRQARHQFMELHQSLHKLISASVSQTSHWELRNWLSGLDPLSPTAKTQKVSCLLGSKAREVWLKGEEMVAVLRKVLGQLENYVRSRECPFPHVIRAGAVFIPMLVVKEILFPQVQGTFIDQILQEHRVELRPTTLSEERHLTQLHKRAFSSKLRKLLSLKHLPDIYLDVLNLLHYSTVCKFLGVELDLSLERDCVECSEKAEGSVSGVEVQCTSPRPRTPDSATRLENFKPSPDLKNPKSKSRVKSACKRMFLKDDSSSPEDEPTQESETWCFASSFEGEAWECVPAAGSDEEGHVEVKIEEDTEQEEPENSWGRPITSDDLLSESSDTETETTSWSSCQEQLSSSAARRSGRSDMVLKLRKVYYSSGRRGCVSHYQRVLDHPEDRDEGSGDRRRRKRTKRCRMRSAEREFSERRRPRHRSYLSNCRDPTRRRWVLRSAVRNAYPDLVGKRILHLYEENDKTEVWYRGMVLRVHEPHPNPLKTVFEVKYDSEPEWQYYLELLVDYKKGWLKIED